MNDLKAELADARQVLEDTYTDMMNTMKERTDAIWKARAKVKKLEGVEARMPLPENMVKCTAQGCDNGRTYLPAIGGRKCKVCKGSGRVAK